jgi:predicted metalloendopeptidase
MILGRYYVNEKFSLTSKVLVTNMMHKVIEAMYAKIDAGTWMDDITKKAARAKLDLFTGRIGFPDHWKQYRGLELDHTSFYDDTITIVSFLFNEQMQSVNQAVDKTVWGMTPPTVNAYYDPSCNCISMPAGILQGFYFNELHHPAVNWGGTGVTFGHEMTHAFDDQGSQYDGTGKFVNWWQPATLDKWHQQTTCLANWFSRYEVLPGYFINGNLTLGENTADTGGIKQAWHAYQAWMPNATVTGLDDLNAQYLDGYTNDQLFFLSYAYGWCVKTTREAAIRRLTDDVHSPGRFRVNGPLSMFPQFGETWGCKRGVDPMYPAEKDVCDVW